MHLCHKHFFMHSSISPMVDVRVLIHTGFVHFSKNMGSNPVPLVKKRFYQVKIKNLGVTSLKELGQLMGQLQRHAVRKAYGKIWDLTMAEVSTEAIASLTEYCDQPLRCVTFGDFQLTPTVESLKRSWDARWEEGSHIFSQGSIPLWLEFQK